MHFRSIPFLVLASYTTRTYLASYTEINYSYYYYSYYYYYYDEDDDNDDDY